MLIYHHQKFKSLNLKSNFLNPLNSFTTNLQVLPKMLIFLMCILRKERKDYEKHFNFSQSLQYIKDRSSNPASKFKIKSLYFYNRKSQKWQHNFLNRELTKQNSFFNVFKTEVTMQY